MARGITGSFRIPSELKLRFDEAKRISGVTSQWVFIDAIERFNECVLGKKPRSPAKRKNEMK